jgi:hypothetical protein
MDHYPNYIDVDMQDIYKDIQQAIYMLHYLSEDAFSKKEIREVCFSLKITLNTLEKMMENANQIKEWSKEE